MAKKAADKTKKRPVSSNGKKRPSAAAGTSKTPDVLSERRRRRAPRQCLIVLGMHRSGTSAVTRVLGLCGATLPKRLMPPVTGNNDFGFWEPVEITKVHDRILSELGMRWNDLADIPASFFESSAVSGWVDELQARIREDYGDAALFIVKDPRLCRLVPMWLETLRSLPAEAAFIIPIRNPLEVAKSLEARDKMSVNHGLLLWLRHFLTAERDTRGCRRVFCHYASLLDDWRSVVDTIEKRLELHLPRRSHRADAEIDTFLTQSARHQVAADEQLMARRDVLSWVKTAYKWAVEAVAGSEAPGTVLDELDDIFTEAEAAFNPVIMQGRLQCEHAQRHARKLTGDLTSLQTDFTAQQSETSRLNEQLKQVTGEWERSEQEVSRLEQQLDEREEELATLLEWSKLAVRWATQALSGGSGTTPQLERVYLALDSAGPQQLPRLAFEGFELAGQGKALQQVADFENERHALTARLNAALKRIDEVEQDRQKLADELDSYRHDAEQRLSAAEQVIAHAKRTCADLQTQSQELSERLTALEGEKDQLHAECETLRKRNSSLSTKLVDAESAHGDLSAQMSHTVRRCEQLEQSLQRAEGERAKLQEQVLQLQEAYANSQDRFERCEDERQQALAACLTAARERDKAYALHMKALSARDEACARADEAITTRMAALEALEEERARCRSAAEQARQSEAKVQATAARLGTLEEALSERDAHMRAVDGERLKLSETLVRVRRERDRTQLTIKDLASKLEQLRSEHAASLQELESLRTRAGTWTSERAQLEDDLKKSQLSAEERELLVVIQRKELEQIKSSATWRLTRPLRAAAGASRIARGGSTDGVGR